MERWIGASVAIGLVIGAALVLLRGDERPETPALPPDVDISGQYGWEPVTIRGGGWVTGLASAPSGRTYARTDVGGAYRWEEATQRWEQLVTASGVPDGVPEDYLVESLAVAPSDDDVVYMGVGGSVELREGRVLRSGDGGRTWRDGGGRFAIHGNAAWRQGAPRLAVDPSDPDIVWLGTRDDGLWRSDDGARTWTSVKALPRAVPLDPAEPAGVSFVVVDHVTTGGSGDPAVWVGVEGIGVLKTEDDGRSWLPVHQSAGVARDVELAGDGALYVVYVGAAEALVKLERDGATSSIAPGSDLGLVAVDPADPDLVIVGGQGVRDANLWRSRDGGDSWDALDVSIESDAAIWPEQTDLDSYMSAGDLQFDPAQAGTLWFGEGMGVWRTSDLDDGAVTFDFESDGIETLVSNDAAKPSGHPLLTAHWDRGLFRHPGPDAAELPLTGDFSSAWSLDVARSDPSFVAAVVDDHRDCCTQGGRDRRSGVSDDGGETWRRFGSIASGDHPEELRFGNIAISSSDVDDLVWVPSRGGAPHFSTDGGDTWLPADYPGSEAHFAHFLRRQVLTADTERGGTFYVLDVDGVFRSTDGGATWVRAASVGLPGPPERLRFNATLVAVPGRAGELLLTTGLLDEGSFGLFHSADAGDTWRELPGLSEVGRVGVGAPLEAGAPAAVYATGQIADHAGLWRSGDLGTTWQLLSLAPAGRHQDISVVTGDPELPGRVYVGFSGTGFVTGTPTAHPGEGDDGAR